MRPAPGGYWFDFSRKARAELLRREPRFSIRWVRALAGEPSPRAAQQRELHLFAGLRKAGIAE